MAKKLKFDLHTAVAFIGWAILLTWAYNHPNPQFNTYAIWLTTGTAVYTGIVPDQPANNDFLAALGNGERPNVATVVPVVLKGRAAAVIYGDDGPDSSRQVDRDLLTDLAGKVAAALEILVLRRKILS